MDPKTWPWSKYNKTKTLKALKEETEKSQELERSLRYLNEKLTTVLDESNAKDNLLEKQEKVAEEALAGWEKAEENAASLKRELDDALQQTVAAEERLLDLDHSLKECMQQLRAVQQEREKMIDDVAVKTLREEEKARILEAKLAEAKKMIAKLVADSDSLNIILETKEEMINDLNDEKIREEEKRKDILAKHDSSEKQNASLKYEVYMLEKELQIRNEEKDFNLKSVKTAHKQHLLSVKKIAELEEECNKLRVMLRKRLPGPAALIKMKSEVEMLGVDSSEAQKKKLNSKKNGTVPSSDAVISRSSGKKDALVERMREIEEENKILRKDLTKKNSELQSSRIMCAHTASKLSHVESQLEGLSNTIAPDAERTNQLSCEIRASNSENGGNDDVMSSAESWASVLTTELEHFKVGKPETSPALRGALDTSLMDDFVEMEKLAVITSGTAHEKSFEPTGEYPVDVPGSSDLNGHTVRSHVSNRSSSSHFKDILIQILQRHHVDQEKVNAILEETRIALTNISRSVSRDFATPTNASPEICCKSQDACSISFRELDCISLLSSESTTQQLPTNLDKAICELIEVVEDIKEKSLSGHVDDKAILLENDESTYLQKESVVHTEFVTRVFRWKSLELKEVLEGCLHVCNALLRGNIGLQKFIREMASTMNWVVQHSFTAEEVPTFNLKEAHRQSELSLAMTVPYEETETDRSSVPDQVKLTFETPSLAPDFAVCCKRNAGFNVKNEIKEGDNTEYQITQHSNASKEHATNHFQDASERTLGLQIEFERLKEVKGLMGHHLDSRKACDAHLSSRIAAAKTDLRDAVQHFPSLKKALEDHGNSFEDARSAYADLQVRPESASTDDKSNVITDQEQQQLGTNWEISVASKKLVECQETILNIEKQLKALAVSGNTALHHSTLCDQLLADDGIKPGGLISGAAEEKTRSDTQLVVQKTSSSDKVGLLYGMKLPTTHNTINQLIANSSPTVQTRSPMKLDARGGVHNKRGMADVGSALAIVPRKQRPQVSFWRRLLLRRNKDSGRKMTTRV